MMATREVTLTVNGRAHRGHVEPRKTLADFIREDCGLTGTHLGCEHGVCGACTILMDGEAVRSCLLFAVQAEGAELRTVEGLADGDRLHPIQQAFWEHHGLQCGFCTPGFLMTAVAFLRDNPRPTEREIREGLAGNLCRCTGYQNIVKAVAAAAEMLRSTAPADRAAKKGAPRRRRTSEHRRRRRAPDRHGPHD
jgi:aerobic carbon-monoxide dehydrogenase small subunit